jgi:TRAP-type C4-dicarboxylate transport system permease small subunit
MPQEPTPESQAQEPKPRVPLAVEEVFAAACMAALALITFANVILRYLTDESIAWTEEISIAIMVVMTLAAAGAAFARERHIRIDYFLERGSPQRQRLFSLIGAAATVLLFAAMAVLGIGLPKWWYSVWLPVLSVAIALRAGGVFLRKWRSR